MKIIVPSVPLTYDDLVNVFEQVIAFTPRSMSFDQIRAGLDAALQEFTDKSEQGDA